MRIDLDTLNTAAIGKLADRKAGLCETKDVIAEEARQRINGMPTREDAAELLARLTDAKTDNFTRAQLTQAYMNQSVIQSKASRELELLEARAAADRKFARRMNELAREAESLPEDLAKWGKLTPAEALDALEWSVQDRMNAASAGIHAGQVIALYNLGEHDLRALALQIAAGLMPQVMRLAEDVLNNGVGGATRSRGVTKAYGVRVFLNAVAEAYGFTGEDARLDVSLLR